MTSKKANRLFFTLILTHIVVSILLSIFGAFIHIGIIANLFLGEAILMVPALLFLWLSPSKSVRQPIPNGYAAERQPIPNGYAAERQPMPNGYAAAPQPARRGMFRSIKVSSALMIALCTFLIMPLVTVLNTLTLFFTDNEVAAIESDIVSVPFPVMFFIIGIFGPFCEEFVFRGMMYGSYTDRLGTQAADGGTVQRGSIAAILLSALTFGLMHMNFNQAVYAFAIGIFLALFVEATGSLWGSVFCHIFFNSFEVIMMYLAKAVLGNDYVKAVSQAATELTGAQLQAGLAVYLVIAAVTTPIAVCVIVWIAKNEGRQDALQALFSWRNGRTVGQEPLQQQMPMNGQGPQPQMNGRQDSRQREPLVTVPLVVAVVISLGFMSLEWFLL